MSCWALLLLCVPGEYLRDANHLWSRRCSFQIASTCRVNLPGEEVFSGNMSLHVSPCHLCQHLHPCRWPMYNHTKVPPLMILTFADQTAWIEMCSHSTYAVKIYIRIEDKALVMCSSYFFLNNLIKLTIHSSPNGSQFSSDGHRLAGTQALIPHRYADAQDSVGMSW